MRLPALLTACLLLFSVALSAQLESRFTMAASFSNITSLTTTTHQVTLNFQSDQLGSGYLANQIQTGWRVLTSTRREYEITTINSSNFSSAQVVLTEIEGTTLAPNGVAVVYAYDGSSRKIPPLPVNSTGISAALQAVILVHNFEIDATGGGGITTVFTGGDITGDGSEGNPVTYTDTPDSWNEITGKPTTFPSGDDVIGNENNRLGINSNTLTIYEADGTTPINSVSLPGGLVYTYDCAAVGTLEELCVHASRVGQATITMGGSASAGVTIDSDGTVKKVIVTGDSNDSNATGEFVLTINQPAISLGTQFYSYQLYDLSNNQKVDEHLTGNVAAQTVTPDGNNSDVRTVIPNISGNYPNGFRLVLN